MELLSPSSGLTAAACKVASAPAHAGFTPSASGNAFAGGNLRERKTGDLGGVDRQLFRRQRDVFRLRTVQARRRRADQTRPAGSARKNRPPWPSPPSRRRRRRRWLRPAAGCFCRLRPVSTSRNAPAPRRKTGPPSAWPMPGLPLRSVSTPRQAMMSAMTAFGRVITGGVGGNDAVAVEIRGGENLRRVRGVLKADGRGVRFCRGWRAFVSRRPEFVFPPAWRR